MAGQMIEFQSNGGTVIAWGPDDALAAPADAQAIAPFVSARRFPPVQDRVP